MVNGASVFLLCILRTEITRFSKVSTTNIFTFFQPKTELVLKLFLILGQTEPHCSSKIVLIKKIVVMFFSHWKMSSLKIRYS